MLHKDFFLFCFTTNDVRGRFMLTNFGNNLYFSNFPDDKNFFQNYPLTIFIKLLY